MMRMLSIMMMMMTLFQDNSCMASLLTFVSYLLVFITLPISIWGCVKVIDENKLALSLSLLLSLCWDDTR